MIQNKANDNDIETSVAISGDSIGDEEGLDDGDLDGDIVGASDGCDVVGPSVGENDGDIVGDCVGACVILGTRSSNSLCNTNRSTTAPLFKEFLYSNIPFLPALVGSSSLSPNSAITAPR